MVKTTFDTPITKGSINFTGSNDSNAKLVKNLTAKNRANLKKVIDSGADSITIQKAQRELVNAVDSAQLKIANDDAHKARKEVKFHKIVISVESRNRDKAHTRIRNITDKGLTDNNSNIDLVFAKRSAKQSSSVIRESQNSLVELDKKLEDSLARQKRFTTRKGIFSR